MIRNKIELIRDAEPKALITWHKPDGEGGTIPIAIEFSDSLEPDMCQRITEVCNRGINLMENGTSTKAFPGSSKHFVNLPKHLARLGFRVRVF